MGSWFESSGVWGNGLYIVGLLLHHGSDRDAPCFSRPRLWPGLAHSRCSRDARAAKSLCGAPFPSTAAPYGLGLGLLDSAHPAGPGVLDPERHREIQNKPLCSQSVRTTAANLYSPPCGLCYVVHYSLPHQTPSVTTVGVLVLQMGTGGRSKRPNFPRSSQPIPGAATLCGGGPRGSPGELVQGGTQSLHEALGWQGGMPRF